MKIKQIAILALLMVVIVTALGGCKSGNNDDRILVSGDADYDRIKDKGTLVVGVTDFAPMDYKEDGNWVGFDAELSEAFAKSLGVEVQFVEIDWDNKVSLLEEGYIDCIWNGMTKTDELKRSIDCSDAYLSNSQVIVLRKSDAKQYDTPEACQHLLFSVEAGSAAESILKEKKYRYITCSSQKEAIKSVSDKKSDAAVIDIVMAAYYTDEGQQFDELELGATVNDEALCIGLRKESSLTEKANEFLKKAYSDGTINTLAEKYGIESAVINIGENH